MSLDVELDVHEIVSEASSGVFTILIKKVSPWIFDRILRKFLQQKINSKIIWNQFTELRLCFGASQRH